MDAGIASAWVEGWAVSRGTAPPVAEPWGWTIDVGLSTQVTRYLVRDADEALLRKLSETLTAPATWIKTFVEPEVLRPWLAPGWAFTDAGFMMTTPLRPGPLPEPPPGYRLRLWTRGEVTRALVTGEDGGYAARGQVAVPDGRTDAVIDQVETSAAHRRRGLGRVVLGALCATAAEAGARRGVLGATPDGRALYTALGWQDHGPLTGVIRED
jgi:GNAT superfamily N-acetyltransferase